MSILYMPLYCLTWVNWQHLLFIYVLYIPLLLNVCLKMRVIVLYMQKDISLYQKKKKSKIVDVLNTVTSYDPFEILLTLINKWETTSINHLYHFSMIAFSSCITMIVTILYLIMQNRYKYLMTISLMLFPHIHNMSIQS